MVDGRSETWFTSFVPATHNTDTGARRGEGSDMDFTTTQPGLVPVGTETPFGVVEAVSLTAYNIGGTWVPFHKLHGRPAAVMPLVVLR
jgi:hypothetical protein